MVEKITLDNGIRIVYEKLMHVRSSAIGIWTQSGSRHEPEELCGISHFIEHMLFKGTEKYSAVELAEEFDSIGGQVNAFTTKEHTCYYARVLDEHVQKAAELLWDMYVNSTFTKENTDLERGVILEEIGMYEDTPEDLVNELLFAKVYDGYSLGRPILGTKATLEKMTGETLKKYRSKCYGAENTLISLSGHFEDRDIEFLKKLFESYPKNTAPELGDAEYKQAIALKKKDIEQNHLILAFPGLPLESTQRYPLQVLNNILGTGMSSRLFQKVREQSGLCYSIYSFASMYFGTGVYGIYSALNKSTEKQAIELIHAECERMKKDGVTAGELSRTKEQLKSNLLMSRESTTSRMTTLARNEFIHGRYIDEDEIVQKVEAVTQQEVIDIANSILDFDKLSFAAVGNVADENEYKSMLK